MHRDAPNEQLVVVAIRRLTRNRRQPGGRGSCARTRKPRPCGPAARVPPNIAIRSRMPSNPWPGVFDAGRAAPAVDRTHAGDAPVGAAVTHSTIGDVAVGQAAIGFSLSGTGAVLALLAVDLDRSPQSLGWLASAFGVGLLLVAATGPGLLRLGAHLVLRCGALGVAAGAVLLAVAHSTVTAGIGAAATGLGGALVVLATPALLRGEGQAARLSRVIGASSAAGVLAPLGLGSVDLLTGDGRLALLLVVPPTLLIALRRAPRPEPPDTTARPIAAVTTSGVLRPWAAIAFAVAAEFCFVVWSVTRLQDAGLGAGAAAAASTTFPVGLAVGRFAAPALAGQVPMLPLGLATAALATVVLVAADQPWVLVVAVLLAGLGVGPLYPLTLARLVARPGLGASASASLGAAASGTAILLAPAGLAVLAGSVGFRLAYLAALPLLGGVLLTSADRAPAARRGHGSHRRPG